MSMNINEYVIALDLGKHDTKSIGRRKDATKDDIQQYKFRTKMLELLDTDVEIGEQSYRLDIDGKTIIIGEQGVELEENFLTSKNSELHKYCAYVMISKYLRPNTTNNKIEIALACPIPVVKIKEAKENYKELIKGNGPIKIDVNGEHYEFEIADIVLKSEDSCIVYMEDLYNEEELGIIGFGGLNMNFLVYKNKEIVYKQAFEHGANELRKYIDQGLRIYKKGNIVNEHELEKALRDGYLTKQGKKDEGSAKVIHERKTAFLEDAKKLILKDGYDIDSLKKLVFIGGTTKELESIILDKYSHASIFNNPQMIAIEGLYKVAAKRYIK